MSHGNLMIGNGGCNDDEDDEDDDDYDDKEYEHSCPYYMGFFKFSQILSSTPEYPQLTSKALGVLTHRSMSLAKYLRPR